MEQGTGNGGLGTKGTGNRDQGKGCEPCTGSGGGAEDFVRCKICDRVAYFAKGGFPEKLKQGTGTTDQGMESGVTDIRDAPPRFQGVGERSQNPPFLSQANAIRSSLPPPEPRRHSVF